jgi:hypothetical protein
MKNLFYFMAFLFTVSSSLAMEPDDCLDKVSHANIVKDYASLVDKATSIEELMKPRFKYPYVPRSMRQNLRSLKEYKALTLCENPSENDIMEYQEIRSILEYQAEKNPLLKYRHLIQKDKKWKGVVVGCGVNSPLHMIGRSHNHDNFLTIDGAQIMNPHIFADFASPDIPEIIDYLTCHNGVPYVFFECIPGAEEPELYKNAYAILQNGGILEAHISNREGSDNIYHPLMKAAGFTNIKTVKLTHPHNGRKDVPHYRGQKP